MKHLFSWVLRYNRIAIVFYVLFLCVGLESFRSVGRQEYPPFTIRNAVILTYYPGRSALDVESQITDPLEETLQNIPEITEVKSNSKEGVSIITIELKETLFDLQPIWQDVRNKVAEVSLPQGASQPFVNDSFGDIYPYIYCLSAEGFSLKEINDTADIIRDQILRVDGVAKVEFHGQQRECIYVDFSESKLIANGLTPSQIGQSIRQHNAVSNSGTIKVGSHRLTLFTKGQYDSLKELGQTRITDQGLTLADIATIYRGSEIPIPTLAHLNGKRVLSIAISMKEGQNVSVVGEHIRKAVHSIQSHLPLGMAMEESFFQPKYVNESVRNFLINLGQSFSFVAVIMLFFAGWRIALIVAILVPSAILYSFSLMPALHIQLEMMSIAALIISLGLLVDNAVVVSEQILVRLSEGLSRKDACIKTVRNLLFPLLVASATTVAAFSPIAIAPGAVSEFTYSLFAIVTATLLSSWVLSITIIPLFCYYFLKPLKRETLIGRMLQKIYTPYEKLLRLAIAGKGWSVALIFAAIIPALWAMQKVPNIFFPPNERAQCLVEMSLPLGSDITTMEERVSRFETWLREHKKEDVVSVSSWIGEGGPRWYLSLAIEFSNPNYAQLTILTKKGDPAFMRQFLKELHDYAAKAFPDVRFASQTLEAGPPVGYPIQIALHGEDIDTLYLLRNKIVKSIEDFKFLYALHDDWDAWDKQLVIDENLAQVQRLGLTPYGIASDIQTRYQGVNVSEFRETQRSLPIIVRSGKAQNAHAEDLAQTPIYGGHGGWVPLGQLAHVGLEFMPGSIRRENSKRVMTIKARVDSSLYASQALAQIQKRINQLLDAQDWPHGYTVSYEGETKESAEAQGRIGGAMPYSLGILSVILMLQFNSFRRFFIIILTIPPMMIGIAIGLLSTGSSFGFMTLLGIIALMGIIVNNAILLIDETDTKLKEGLSVKEGVVAAAKSRLRPILITTLTTIIGLLPLGLAGGGMWSSMAYAMMFGLGFATVLTLVLCPVLYTLFFRKNPFKPS